MPFSEHQLLVCALSKCSPPSSRSKRYIIEIMKCNIVPSLDKNIKESMSKDKNLIKDCGIQSSELIKRHDGSICKCCEERILKKTLP